MLIYHNKSHLILNCLKNFRRYLHHLSAITEECNYPPIQPDMSPEGLKKQNRLSWYDSIKALPTVEEKLYELAVQQMATLQVFTLSSCPPTYHAIPFQKYITRTYMIKNLPQNILNMDVDNLFNEIKTDLCEYILYYFSNIWQAKNFSDNILLDNNYVSNLITGLITLCYKKFALANNLLESTIHKKPRIESFWWHSGFKDTLLTKFMNDNLCFQFKDYPTLVIRTKNPLFPVIEFDDALCSTAEVEKHLYHPKVFGIPYSRRFCIASIPGFWPGDPYEFPLLQVYTKDKLSKLCSKIENYNLANIEDGLGIMSSFGLLNSVATYQGFTPFHDLTYPLVTQTILTDGQDWNFFVYQLNTFCFHSDVDMKNRRNLCWSSGKMRLFDSIEDGQIKGINDDVFKILLKLIFNNIDTSDNVERKPYLGEDKRSDYDAANMRFFLRKMYSRAPDPNAHKYEIPMWQKIYKLHPDAPPSPFVKLA